MEKALQKHQLEKAALFRKRPMRAPEDVQRPAPVFTPSFGPASTSGRIFSGFEGVDPLSAPETRRVQSMFQLRPSGDKQSPTPIVTKPSTMSLGTQSTTSTRKRRKMPPAAWSKFPSYARSERCGSAGHG